MCAPYVDTSVKSDCLAVLYDDDDASTIEKAETLCVSRIAKNPSYCHDIPEKSVGKMHLILCEVFLL